MTGDKLQHRHKVTPYEGQRFTGRVDKTVLRGHTVFDAGRFDDAPKGIALTRSACVGPES